MWCPVLIVFETFKNFQKLCTHGVFMVIMVIIEDV